MQVKTGPLTKEELMKLWKSVTDPRYSQPLLDKENSNIEIIEQSAAQLAEVSRAVDENTQSLYILPWSGQTSHPATGEKFATVTLSISRSKLTEIPLILSPGEFVVEQRLDDYGDNGAVNVSTNRQYTLLETVVFMPGDAGPKLVAAIAVQPGAGYNHPTPDTITNPLQPGAGFSNLNASVVNNQSSNNQVVAWVMPDVPVPEHIGQYLMFTSGQNQGRIRRIIGVEPPLPDVHGGIFNVAAEVIVQVTLQVGTFRYGERVSQAVGGQGLFLGQTGSKILLLRTNNVFNNSQIVGEYGAVATIMLVEQSSNLTPESQTAGWKVLPWADLGLAVTNPQQPVGGASATLDALGAERNLPRFNAEDDDSYRDRISKPADVVSPNAIIRAGNRVLAEYDETACLREVGRPLLPGLFFDGDPTPEPFAFDLDMVELDMLSGNQIDLVAAFFDNSPYGFFDNPSPQSAVNAFSVSTTETVGVTGFIPGEVVSSVNAAGIITTGIAMLDMIPDTTTYVFRGVARIRGPGFEAGTMLRGHTSGWEQLIINVTGGLRAQDRFNVMLDLVEHRGFFMLGVPRMRVDDFGVFFDSGADNAFDVSTVDNFFDGSANGANSIYSRIWNEVDRVRGGGVRFDLYIEEIGCI